MKKRLSILAVLLLAITVTAYSVSGTYAKYTSNFTGKTSTARVAKWAFQLKNDNGEYKDLAANFDFDLFKTIKDTEGAAETDVKVAGTGENSIIAPGTSGKVVLTLKNDSEVNANYTVKFTDDKAGVPIEYKVNDGAWVTTMADVTNAINMNSEATITIEWRWVFENGADDAEKAARDTSDTTLGVAGTATPTVSANITVTQVD